MRAIGRLFGLRAPDPSTARVLELGCAGGSNLLPLAYALPDAQFVGIDLSPRQIDLARTRAAKLGLANTQLEAISIEDAGAIKGEFDYIICHGVYSWVPESVRTAILQLIHDRLSPNGIGFVSYNALPGWHLRNAVRDMMVYHGRYFPTVEERAQQARALVDFVAESGSVLSAEIPGIANANQAIAATRDIITRYPDYYVVHEFLESDNRAFYLYEFVDQLDSMGLQYLGDTSLASMVSGNLPGEIAATLERISVTAVALEQYRDFLVNRTFKHSLVCRADVVLERQIEPGVARDFSFRGSSGSLSSNDSDQIPGADGRLITLNNPIGKAAVDVLRTAYPAEVPWDELVRALATREVAIEGDELERVMLHLLAHDVVEAIDGPLAPPTTGANNPTAWLPARVFAEHMTAAPTRYLTALGVTGPGQAILGLLDGTQTEDEVIEAARPALNAETVSYELTDGVIAGPDVPPELTEEIGRSLILEFRKHGVLEN